MSSKQPLDPIEALDAFLQIVRDEAVKSPEFLRRLLAATGQPVMFRGDDAVQLVDPVTVARDGLVAFRQTFLSMSAANIKKIGKSHGFFVGREPLPREIGPLVDLLWNRATQRLRDLSPHAREAAE